LRRPLLRDGARDQRADLLSILCDLRLEIGNASFLGLIGCLLARESLRQRQEMVASIGERSFAFPRLGVDLPLPEFERSLLDLILDLELTQPLAGGVVVMSRGLAGKFQGALPHAVGKIRDLARHPGEGGGVALDTGAQIPPKPA
jgi:hypothetical protein